MQVKVLGMCSGVGKLQSLKLLPVLGGTHSLNFNARLVK